MVDTPLHRAIIENQPIGKHLTQYDPQCNNSDGFSALALAKYLGRKEWLKLLLPHSETLEQYYTQTVHYTFCSHLLFSSYESLLSAARKSPIQSEWKELGVQYSNEIFQGIVLDAEVRFINDQAGYGLFSKKKYNKGAYIGEYVGLVGEYSPYLRINNYLYQYPVPDSIGRPLSIDGESISNHVRFINHSAEPNCTMQYALFDAIPHAILIANCTILPGEQFTYNYGESFWLIRGKNKIISF